MGIIICELDADFGGTTAFFLATAFADVLRWEILLAAGFFATDFFAAGGAFFTGIGIFIPGMFMVCEIAGPLTVASANALIERANLANGMP